jgi:hypothetical protein
MKLSNEGEYLWTKTFECNGIGSSNSSNITVLNNEIIIIGSFKGTVDFNFENGIDEYTETGPTGGSNGFITKLSTDGSYLWTRISKNVYGSNNSLTTDNLGDTYIAGYFEGTINFNSNENIDEHTSNGNEDIFITKINGNGSYIWTKTIGGGSSDRAYSIITDNSGNLYFTGSFFETVDFDPSEGIDEHTSIGGADIFITKLSSDGEYKYTKIMGSKRYDGSGVGASLSFDSNNIYITGDFYETVDFNSSEGIDEHVSIGESDVFITKLSSDGEYKYTKIIGGKYSDSGQVVDVKNNNVYILGKYADAVDFDPSERVDEIIAIQGLNNSFLWKWSQDEVPTCTIITCPENEHCILENNNSGCVCDDNFHLNGNYQCIAD